MKYLALLRGINVGGNKKVPMAILKKMFESLGYENVTTLLNSGNVIFESSSAKNIKETLEKEFETQFKFKSSMIITPLDEIKEVVKENPFKGIEVTKDTRLYVTFLADKPNSKLKIPFENKGKGGIFTILKVTDFAVFSVLQISEAGKTTELMVVLEKEFGKNVTTRNWNTVTKASLA